RMRSRITMSPAVSDPAFATTRTIAPTRYPSSVDSQDAAMPRVQFSTHCAVLTLVPSPSPPGTARDTSVLPDEDHPTPISSHAKFASPVPKVAENVTWRPEITGPPETCLRALFVPTRSDCATFGAVVP